MIPALAVLRAASTLLLELERAAEATLTAANALSMLIEEAERLLEEV